MEMKKSKILVVDDEPDISGTLCHFLSAKGYTSRSAASAEEALHIIAREKIDLILLDYLLPGMNGLELAKLINQRYPAMKVVIITGYPETKDLFEKNCLLEGLFFKPLGIQDLYGKLINVLKEDDKLHSPDRQPMKARVLIINAKILIAEPLPEISHLIDVRLKRLAYRGENYSVETISDVGALEEKIRTVMPDIALFNITYFQSLSKEFTEQVLNHVYKPKEVIIYSVPSQGPLDESHLEQLEKNIQLACLKNGLIEVKWVEV